jgi:hypothetical protein
LWGRILRQAIAVDFLDGYVACIEDGQKIGPLSSDPFV